MTRVPSVFRIGVIATLAAAFLLAASSAIAQASTPLGTRIVCFVYSNLNDFGSPIPLLTNSDCGATSTPPGGGQLTVVKDVVGGSAQPSDFAIHVSLGGSEIAGSPQPGASSGTTYIGIAPGNYVVSETGAATAEYTASFSDDCRRGGVVAVTSNYPATCVVTNTAIASGTPPASGTVGGSLTGSVFATSTQTGTTTGTSTLTGTVGGGSSLTGTVSSPPGGGSGGGGGGATGNGPPVSGGGASGAGGGGAVLVPVGGGTAPGIPNTGVSPASATTSPGIPNTGDGGGASTNAATLALSAIAALTGIRVLFRRPRRNV